MPKPQDFEFDGVWGLVDMSWSQQIPQIQPDDIDKDPKYNQYPYQEVDEYGDEEEEMEVDDQALGNAGGACMAAPTGTQCSYRRPEATYTTMTDQTPGSPRSIHTDTEVAIEMGSLTVSSSRPEARKVVPRAVLSQEPERTLSTPDLVSSLTKGMAAAATEILEKFAHLPPVDDATDAALWECFQQWRAAVSQPAPTSTAVTGRTSALDRLGHHRQSPQKEDQWQPRLEMTPWKIERGQQLDWGQEHSSRADQESPCSTSQKRHSQSCSRDEVNSKKGRTKGDGRSHNKVQVGIDWAHTGIQKPVPKPDPHHPSFKPDLSGAGDDPQPRVRLSVAARGSCQWSHSCSRPTASQEPSQGWSERTESRTSRPHPARFPGDPEKRELKDKSYNWIAARIHRLDPKGYVEEINFLLTLWPEQQEFCA